MAAISLNQVLILYAWFPLAALITIMLMIARFYESFSGERSYFRWYLLPIILFAGGAVRYSSVNQITGDLLADILITVAGISLLILSVHLYRLMTTGRKRM
jgi:hypothetical protein